MKKILTLLAAAMMVFGASGCTAQGNAQTGTDANKEAQKQAENTEQKETKEKKLVSGVLQAELPQKGDEIAVIQTDKGEMRMMFYPEEAPKAVENFKSLAKQGYFDGLTFHRVIDNFMIQTGDPTATGTGGESIWGEPFEDEISPNLHFFKGAVAMANSGPNTNGSQFFIVQNPVAEPQMLEVIQNSLDSDEDLSIKYGEQVIGIKEIFSQSVMDYYKEKGGSVQLEYVFGSGYTIFGQVYSGLETIDAVAAVETDASDKPLEDVTIQRITFEEYQG